MGALSCFQRTRERLSRVLPLMKPSSLCFPLLTLFLAGWSAKGAEPDDFAREAARMFDGTELVAPEEMKGPGLDRTRGQVVFDAKESRYEKGAHFGKWFWPDFTGDRWGTYQVKVEYASAAPKQGFQFFIGKHKAKGYLGPTGSLESVRRADLDQIKVPDRGTYPVGILSGDDSNSPVFQLRRVILEPSPEGESPAQSIDGTVEVPAGCATTFSRLMRFEQGDGKNCLAAWTEVADWAEWWVDLHQGGKFRVEVVYGCGDQNHGSEFGLWIGDAAFTFVVEDTGGFQSWKPHAAGELSLPAGRHRVVLKPLQKAAGEMLALQRVTLTPLAAP